jgi:sulfur relay (sulfurtransferase) complex TusBCD TusD component (DsrE family)
MLTRARLRVKEIRTTLLMCQQPTTNSREEGAQQPWDLTYISRALASVQATQARATLCPRSRRNRGLLQKQTSISEFNVGIRILSTTEMEPWSSLIQPRGILLARVRGRRATGLARISRNML